MPISKPANGKRNDSRAKPRGGVFLGGPLSAILLSLCFFEGSGIVDTPIHTPGLLTPGQEISGPAIIETPFTTIVIDPQARFHLTGAGSVNITP